MFLRKLSIILLFTQINIQIQSMSTALPSILQDEKTLSDQTTESKKVFTIADLRREVATTNSLLGSSEVRFVAPRSLKIALNKLNAGQEAAFNSYHREIVEKPRDQLSYDDCFRRSILLKHLERSVVDEQERNEIMDNLRWLQESTDISIKRNIPLLKMDEAIKTTVVVMVFIIIKAFMN